MRLGTKLHTVEIKLASWSFWDFLKNIFYTYFIFTPSIDCDVMTVKIFLNISERIKNSIWLLAILIFINLIVSKFSKILWRQCLYIYLTCVAALPFLVANALSPCHCRNTNLGRLVFGSTTFNDIRGLKQIQIVELRSSGIIKFNKIISNCYTLIRNC